MNLKREKKFINDLSKAKLSDSEFNKMIEYFSLLSSGKPLPPSANDHALNGEYAKYREFHIGGDKLVIYLVKDDEIRLLRKSAHIHNFLSDFCGDDSSLRCESQICAKQSKNL